MRTFRHLYVHFPPSLLEPGVITLMSVTTGEVVLKPWSETCWGFLCNDYEYCGLNYLKFFNYLLVPFRLHSLERELHYTSWLLPSDPPYLGYCSPWTQKQLFTSLRLSRSASQWFNQNHRSLRTTNYSTFELLYCFNHTCERSQTKSLL